MVRRSVTGVQKAAAVGGKAYAYGKNQAKRPLGSFKKGGMVKKTGLYKLHKGEKVMSVKAMKARR